MEYSFRNCTLEDFDFLFKLKKENFKVYVDKIWGWKDDDQKERLQQDLKEHLEHKRIILNDNRPIGVYVVHTTEEGNLFINEISILKEYQHRGIGRKILEEQLRENHEKGIRTTLQVFKNNPAKSLYEKLGFKVYEETETHYKMENMKNDFLYKYENDIAINQLVKLFESVGWKTAEYPNRLYNAIKNSEYVMTVWEGEKLVGLISAITDGYINVFITYLLVNPEYQKIGLGKRMMNDFMKKFEGFGRRILTTELDKEEYYKKFGFNIDGIAMFNKDWKEDI